MRAERREGQGEAMADADDDVAGADRQSDEAKRTNHLPVVCPVEACVSCSKLASVNARTRTGRSEARAGGGVRARKRRARRKRVICTMAVSRSGGGKGVTRCVNREDVA